MQLPKRALLVAAEGVVHDHEEVAVASRVAAPERERAGEVDADEVGTERTRDPGYEPRQKFVQLGESGRYCVRASAPATTSRISCVISAWRARLSESVRLSISSPAFFDALRIAVIWEARNAAADSSRAR